MMFRREWGDGAPVVALHPLGLDSSGFEGFGRALARRGLRTIAVDLPGFGRTPAPPMPLRPAVLAEPVIELARSLDSPPIALGISLGGRVALEAALRAPDAFRAVIAIAPALPWLRYRFLVQGAAWLRPSAADYLPLEQVWGGLRWLAEALERVPWIADDELARSGVRLAYYLTCPATRAAFLSAARELTLDPPLGDDGFWTRLPRLAPPAAFVWGDRDRLISPSFARPVARSLPGARQLSMPCVGHWLNGPHHRCLAEAVAALLEEMHVGAPACTVALTADPLGNAGGIETRPCLIDGAGQPASREAASLAFGGTNDAR
jgi:pimeloyl-ACP methyl ester carboxylesterase